MNSLNFLVIENYLTMGIRININMLILYTIISQTSSEA